MKRERLPKSLQENLVVAICFDIEQSKIIRNAAEPSLFESVYREIIIRAYNFIDDHGAPPKDHIADLLDDILNGKDKGKAKLYKDLLLRMYEAKDGLNSEYTLNRLESFIRQQRLKNGIMEAYEFLQSDADDAAAQAENVLTEAMKNRLNLFKPGIRLTDMKESFAFLDQMHDSFRVGISEIDRRGLGPARKELHLFIALPKRGKTWWFVNMGKRAILNRIKVCHITLEMSEAKMAMRYIQSLFSVSKDGKESNKAVLVLDRLKRLTGIDVEKTKGRLSLKDKKIRGKLEKRINKWGIRLDKLIIKEFATGQLTIPELKAYLDALESTQGFIPDLLIVDYADLMNIDSKNYRMDLGKIYKDLRGIAVDRNIAIATASQSKREGLKASLISEGDVAEDWSKIATADTIITYSQTQPERLLGLARLFVAAARNDEDKQIILITQNYSTGQFVIEATLLQQRYFSILEKLTEPTDEDLDEEDEDDDE